VHSISAMALEVHIHVGAPRCVATGAQPWRLCHAASAGTHRSFVLCVCIRTHNLLEWRCESDRDRVERGVRKLVTNEEELETIAKTMSHALRAPCSLNTPPQGARRSKPCNGRNTSTDHTIT
jgi:hypothetical protein